LFANALHGDTSSKLNEFRSVAAKLAIDAAQDKTVPLQTSELFELEAKTWEIAELLFSFRYAQKPSQLDISSTSSNALIEENLYRVNPKARETVIVRHWLQNNFPTSDIPQLHDAKWPSATIKKTKRSVLDPDAPLRDDLTLSSEDRAVDSSFFKYVYQLLQSGQFQQIHDVCSKTGNFQFSITLNGLIEYRDSALENNTDTDYDMDSQPTGTTRKGLWRAMCAELANAAHPALSAFEKACYAFLSGELEPLLAVSDSWESSFLAYVNHLATCNSENYLTAYKRRPELTEPSVESMEQILEILADDSYTPAHIVNESNNPLRIIQGAIINNNLWELFANTVKDMNNVSTGVTQFSIATDSPDVLRILTHLALVTAQLEGESLSSENHTTLLSLLGYYIDYLTSKSEFAIIPIYMTQLDASDIVELYSVLLADLTDPVSRHEQLTLSRKLDIDIENSLRRAVERIFDRYASVYETVSKPVSEKEFQVADASLIKAVEWYIEASMWDDVVYGGNILLRRFLLAGRAESAQKF
ncbi:hypothetical protein CANCADRAFT_12559, partial [Tortispora caseinolytica NRRL Y-17796]